MTGGKELQPRHLIPLDEGGGEMNYQEYRDSPQEMWVVTEETMQNNRDAVCAYLAGWIAAKQWLSEGTITRTTRRKASP